MRIAIAKAATVSERRVAMTPDVVARLVKQGLEVWVEAGAGAGAFHGDAAYEAAGAEIVADGDRLWRDGQVVLKLDPPSDAEIERLSPGSTFISFLNPLAEPLRAKHLADRGVTAFAMELIPRSSRAQSADALSSQASIAGYKAVLLAAATLPKYFPMLTTAAGTIAPAKVLILGAGVAGLQAIATARRLGAIVEAFDIRPETKEQVQSLGAKFVDVDLEEDTRAEGGYAKEVSEAAKRKTQEVLAQHVAASDVVITTAQVPGKRAPILMTRSMVEGMKPGSVVVDLAAGQGGNCECSEAGKDVQHQGVTVLGPVDLPSSVPVHASQLFGKNLATLLGYLRDADGEFCLNFEDDIIDAACLTHGGEIRNDRVKSALAQEQETANVS